jgi:hypothetical protein
MPLLPKKNCKFWLPAQLPRFTPREKQTNAMGAYFASTLKNRGAAVGFASCQTSLGRLCFFSEFVNFIRDGATGAVVTPVP